MRILRPPATSAEPDGELSTAVEPETVPASSAGGSPSAADVVERSLRELLATDALRDDCGPLDETRKQQVEAVVCEAAAMTRPADSGLAWVLAPLLLLTVPAPYVLAFVIWDLGVGQLIAVIVATGVEFLLAATVIDVLLSALERAGRDNVVVGVQYTLVMLAVATTVVALSVVDRPSDDLLLALALPLGASSVWMGMFGFAAALEVNDRRQHRDPFAVVVCSLVEALSLLPGSPSDIPPDGEPGGAPLPERSLATWSPDARRAIALQLAVAAREIERNVRRMAPDGGTREVLADRGTTMAAWLRARAADALVPGPEAVRVLKAQLSGALLAAVDGRWSRFGEGVDDRAQRSQVRVWAPRLASSAALVVAAFAAPVVLDGVITAAEAEKIRAALLIGAAGALVAPASQVAENLKELRSRLK